MFPDAECIVCGHAKGDHERLTVTAWTCDDDGCTDSERCDIEHPEPRCSCGNPFDGDNFCMPSACQWEGLDA